MANGSNVRQWLDLRDIGRGFGNIDETNIKLNL
jgi:hypothetical protein